MPTEVHTPPEQSLTGLLSGIIGDFGDLVRQEIRFAKAEIKSDLNKSCEAATLLATGVGVASVAGLLLAWMLVYLLHWLTIPADAPETAATAARLPLWACYGIVGAALAIVGGFMVAAGVRKFKAITPPGEQTAQTVKENAEWIANSK